MTVADVGSDRDALERALAVRPIWDGVTTAGDALSLQDRMVLHAGPPYSRMAEVPPPVRNSVLVAAVYEGWASDFSEAARQFDSGDFLLEAAQDRGVVTPLATVVSGSMTVQVVRDLGGGPPILTPLNGGMGPAMRYGQCNQDVLDRVRWLNTELAPLLACTGTDPIALIPLAEAGLLEGDDCHGRTAEATRRLTELLRRRVGSRFGAAGDFLDQAPGFFLNLWMAACKCALRAMEGTPAASLVTGMGGNGVAFGVQVAARPGHWFTAPAQPPRGPLKAGMSDADRLGAIGDSAIVEGFGFGAMTWHRFHSPALNDLSEFLPQDAAQRAETLLLDVHPAFGDARPRVGLRARSVVQHGYGPLVSLGIVHQGGTHGLLAPGVYDAPVEPFAMAVGAIDGE